MNNDPSWPKISIVTPSYNQAEFLERTILSVLNQNYPNLEYIIIDGGSTDGSVEIIQKYEKYLSYWVSEKDKGQSDAINKGFCKCTGEILAYLNSDDTYCENALKFVGEFFRNNPETDFVYGNSKFTNENDEPVGIWKAISYDFHLHLYAGSIIPQPSAFWRREIFLKVGQIDESLHFAMDGDLWFRMAKSNSRFHYHDAIFSCFRIHNSSKSVASMEKHRLEALRVREQIMGRSFSIYERCITIPMAKFKKRLLGARVKVDLKASATSKISPEKVKRFFDCDATNFADTRWMGSVVAKQDYKITTEFLLDFLGVDATNRMLEIGCGPGVWTNLISSKCKHVTAIDMAGEMIKQAQKRVAGNNVTFCETDFVKFHDDELFDRVFSVRVIEYFPDPMEVVRKIDNLLKMEGKAVIITKTHPSLITLRAKLWGKIKKICSKGTNQPVPPMKMIPPGKLRRMFLKEGFKKVDIYPVVLRSPLFINGKYKLPGKNEEIQKKYEMSMLRFANTISRKSKTFPRILRFLLLPFSETYLVLAEK